MLADQLGRPEEAEAAYRKAIELDPAYACPWNSLGILLADKLGRPDEAEAAYRKAIELDPAFGLACGNLGRLLEEQSRFDEALGAYAQAVTLDSENASYWRSRTKALKARLRAASARKALQFGDLAATREALAELLSKPEDLAATLAGPGIVEDMLAATLEDERKARRCLGCSGGSGSTDMPVRCCSHSRPLSRNVLSPLTIWSPRSAVPPDACTTDSSPAARRPLRADGS